MKESRKLWISVSIRMIRCISHRGKKTRNTLFNKCNRLRGINRQIITFNRVDNQRFLVAKFSSKIKTIPIMRHKKQIRGPTSMMAGTL